MATPNGSGFALCAQAVGLYQTIDLAFRYRFRPGFIPQKTILFPVAHSPPEKLKVNDDGTGVPCGSTVVALQGTPFGSTQGEQDKSCGT